LPIGLAPFWSFTIPERCRLRRPPLSKLVGCSIAATAAVHNLIIVTANTRHFEHFGVPFISPFDEWT